MQGVNCDGVEMSSAFVLKDENDVRFGLDCSVEPSLTRQEFAEECDINILMSRYEKTGQLPPMSGREPRYLDLAEVGKYDLAHVMQVLNDAEASFMSLPALVRAEFENDPVKFVEYAEKPENIGRLRDLGLAKPLVPKPEPQEVRIVAETAPGASPEAGGAPAGTPKG